MNDELKVCLGFAAIFISFAIIAYILDCFIEREARRQFYRDLLRLVLLYDQPDSFERSIQVPKILGPRIIRFASYAAVINDLSNNYYEAGQDENITFIDYVFSLHRSYCFSNRDLIKFKNKLLKEKTK